MFYRKLGTTGISVSELGFGAWAIGGSRYEWSYGPTDDSQSLAAIDAALEFGCTMFDTADIYGRGHSERLLGKKLHGRRSSLVIADKVGFDFYHGVTRSNFHPAYLRFALHQSLRRLQTDYLDLLLLHNPSPEVMFASEVIDSLCRLREQGKVRAIGISVATVDHGSIALEAGWPEIVELPYNMLSPDAERYFLPAAYMARIGVIVREALANGVLTGKYRSEADFGEGDIRALWPKPFLRQVIPQLETLRLFQREGETLAQLALRFALEPVAVSTVLCGCKTADQAKENFAVRARVFARA